MKKKKAFFDPKNYKGGQIRLLPPPDKVYKSIIMKMDFESLYPMSMKPFSEETKRKIKVGHRKDKLKEIFGDEFETSE
jgi:DNA polymerase elongation subunit (family B)